jgi:2-oxoglutarate ferredoxin oxidoreductase subunit gamma
VEVRLRLIGAGGHGILLAGNIIGTAATVYSSKNATMVIAYSPAQRGGWSRADVVVSDEPIDFPIFDHPDVLVATTQETYDLEIGNVRSGGLIVYEEDTVKPAVRGDVTQLGVPAFRTAIKVGFRISANMVTLGFLTELLKLLPHESVKSAIKAGVKRTIKGGYEILEVDMPFLASVELGCNTPRFPDFKRKRWAEREFKLKTWSIADLGLSHEEVGFKGSATTVDTLMELKLPERLRSRITGAPDEIAEELARIIRELLR